MAALSKPDDAESRADGHSAGDPPVPPTCRGGKQRDRGEIKAHRRIAARERAIARALIGGHKSAGEFFVATEFRHLHRASAAPMILEDRVDGEAWSQGQSE